MDAILFTTKVLYLFGLPSNQDNTIVLSHHACTSCMGMSNACLTLVSSLESKVAPHSSSLGMESCLMGATLVLAVTSLQVGSWLV